VTLLAAGSKSASVWAQPGTLGFLVVFGMGVILFFVFRSMAKQLRKVREAARIEAEQQEARAKAESGQPGANSAGSRSADPRSGDPRSANLPAANAEPSADAALPPIDLSGRAQSSSASNNGSLPRS
jgi:hypothetical protein